MQEMSKMLTRQSPDGNWEVTGIPWSEIQGSLYGALCKLRDYEKTGLQPGQIVEMNELYLEKCREVNALKRKDRWSMKNRNRPRTGTSFCHSAIFLCPWLAGTKKMTAAGHSMQAMTGKHAASSISL